MNLASFRLPLLTLILLVSAVPSFAGPRDAIAVLNRCGKPHNGDTVILENTVAGGRRILAYERGVLNFDRVQNDGWTFTTGEHGQQKGLTAAQMETHLPCLKAALADSASPEQIKLLTPEDRIVNSAKESYKALILWSVVAVGVIGLILFLLSRRKREDADE